METIEGRVRRFEPDLKLHNEQLVPKYALQLDERSVVLNDYVGCGMTISYLDERVCSECGQSTPKFYNRNFCYACFSTLARCDLCFVSPDRCHIHLGTCREPQWAQDFCMQPHTVYLSSTSDAKVGITREGREHRRWVDQGAGRAVKLIWAPTRRAAGVVEAFIKRYVHDKTDWRRLVSGRVKTPDLAELAAFLREKIPLLADIDQGFVPAHEMQALRWHTAQEIVEVKYPVASYAPAERLKLARENPTICDNLYGIVGQYLLLSQGVINLLEYQAGGLQIALGEPVTLDPRQGSDQLSLF